MIEIIALHKIKPSSKAAFIKQARELITKSQQEPGCIKYNLYEDTEDGSILTFIETWESLDAIEKHNNSKHFKDIVPLLQAYVVSLDVRRYKKV